MAKSFYDQDAPDPAESPFFEGELAQTKDSRLSMAEAVTIVGVFAILFAPFTIALAVVIAR